MTHSDYTKEILNIKDENIHFDENCLKIVNIKGKQTKVFHEIITYIHNIVLIEVLLTKVLMTL